MQPMFEALLELLKEPVRLDRGVKTDNSILLVYPPEKELDFREQLVDGCFPALEAQGSQFHALDLTGFMFDGLSDDAVASLREEELDDYRWMLQGLSKRVEASLKAHLKTLAGQRPGGNVVVYGTVALYPLVRFGEVLRDMRDLHARIAVAFPGEERGGRLHFMSQPDGGNYLAVKLFWR
ncbi:MAG: hypothetical protein HYV63_15545 [Candidatus Schekmanbacteria bacterium]|nr:hypothetical protein [Candidatus Schekmanbacteria bacterium]